MANKSNEEQETEKPKYFFADPYDKKNPEGESFARFTVDNRFPKIFCEHCSGDYETDFLQKSIEDVLGGAKSDKPDLIDLLLKYVLDAANEKIQNPSRDYSAPPIRKKHNKKIEANSQESSVSTQNEKEPSQESSNSNKKEQCQESLTSNGKGQCKENPNDALDKSSTLKDFFDNAPFFESEVLFYHALLAQKRYFSNHYDFFATEKKDSLVSGQAKFIENLNSLFNSEIKDKEAKDKLFISSNKNSSEAKEKEEKEKVNKDIFHKCIRYCLSANTSDLSQLNAKERFNYEAGDIRILHDDTDILYEYLDDKKKFQRFDIICDNAGKELFSDLYLACYFLHNNIVDKIVFHLKPYPFFVSDATKKDFGFMMNAVTQNSENICARKCREYVREGKIEIEDNNFGASPLCFKDMPANDAYKDLYKKLCNSDLIIVKGDLNYRRLVEDRNWNHTDSFAERTQTVFGHAPIFAPRVIKSDVLIGISEAAYETAKSSDKHGSPADQRFKGSGKWAVVHFRCDRYEQYKEKVQKRNNPQTKHDDSDDSKNEEKKHPVTNSSDQQDEKNPNNGKKNIFYITVNVCYILATVLILAMLVVSTVPVIAQTKTQGNTDYRDASDRIDFALLLTGYTIFLTGTIILPRYLLRGKVKEEVAKQLNKDLPDEVKKEVTHQTQYGLKKIHANEYKLDGDLSRMIAYLLMKNEMPVWSIGWSFHAIKRYISLECILKKEEHILFLDLLRQTILKNAVSLFCEYLEKWSHLKETDKNKINSILKKYDLQNDGCSKFTKAICYEAFLSDETKPEMPVLRAVKDIIDVEFIVKNNIYNWDEQSQFLQKCRDISLFMGAFARFVIYSFIYFPFDDWYENKSPLFSKEELVENIIKISSFNSNPIFSNQYKDDLKKSVDHIYMNGLHTYYKDEYRNNPSMKDAENILALIYTDKGTLNAKKKKNLFFFADEKSSYPIIRE